MRTRMLNRISYGGDTRAIQLRDMNIICDKIANELEWSSYVDDWQKQKMVGEVLNKFSILMAEAIKIASEK